MEGDGEEEGVEGGEVGWVLCGGECFYLIPVSSG